MTKELLEEKEVTLADKKLDLETVDTANLRELSREAS